eukprot:1385739-Prymnesium_polylepis.2
MHMSTPPSPTPSLPNVTYSQLVSALALVPYRDAPGPDGLPTQANQIEAVAHDEPSRMEAIGRMASETAPFLHSRTLRLAEGFLELKKREGSAIERQVYGNMDAHALLTRLVSNRPLVFMGESDQYLLRTVRGPSESNTQRAAHTISFPLLRAFLYTVCAPSSCRVRMASEGTSSQR